jgi:hypothetical protein
MVTYMASVASQYRKTEQILEGGKTAKVLKLGCPVLGSPALSVPPYSVMRGYPYRRGCGYSVSSDGGKNRDSIFAEAIG